jgi:hypothetical protein
MTSSKISTAPCRVQFSRNACRNPAPEAPGSCCRRRVRRSRRRFLALRLEGRIELRDIVVIEHQRMRGGVGGTPAELGLPNVSAPEPAFTSSESACP